MSHIIGIRNQLNNIIDTLASEPNDYVNKPGHDFTRNRKLGLSSMVKLILSMKGSSLNKELIDYENVNGVSITASAFVQQRSKLKSSFFEKVFHEFNNAHEDQKTFCGYHLFAVDGTDLNIPRDPNADTFITSDNSDGYNQYHINVIYDLCNKTYKDCVLQPRPSVDERGALITMLQRNCFKGKSIVIGDRGYEGFNIIAHFKETSDAHFLIRVKHGGIKEIKELPMQELDKDISITVTTTQTNEDKLNGYRFIQTGSKKGKKNSSKTVISRWDFDSPYTVKFRVVRLLLENGEFELSLPL